MTREELLQIAKPVLFNTEMTVAILEDRKGATRRCMKPQPTSHLTTGPNWQQLLVAAAPCHVGDVLYVRETWRCWRAHRYEANADIMFRAGGSGVRLQFAYGNTDSINRNDFDRFVGKWYSEKWHPSIHMPKEVARIFLRVTDVRVERLKDITVEDIRREGLTSMAVHAGDAEIAYEEWKQLWNSTIKKSDLPLYGWDANPWVWVIEFERINTDV